MVAVVDKAVLMDTICSLEGFLNRNFLGSGISESLLDIDTMSARKYYKVLRVMRESFVEERDSFLFPAVEMEGFYISENGKERRREINFDDIKAFSEYLAGVYGV